MRHNLAAFRRLESRERFLLLAALALLPWAQLAVAVLPLPKLMRLAHLRSVPADYQLDGPSAASATACLSRQARVRKIFRIIERKFPFWPGRCLAQALVARFFLRRQGVTCLLILGAKHFYAQPGQAFKAHAWLKSGGVVITGDGHEQYIPVAHFL
ncbi:MAG: lasso peptide biosynthesis B2 protein [Desulfobulbaceae bacterium]|nr:lasso peptide biosynthesis B2 protein [Desulfobulbaceae bacterium]